LNDFQLSGVIDEWIEKGNRIESGSDSNPEDLIQKVKDWIRQYKTIEVWQGKIITDLLNLNNKKNQIVDEISPDKVISSLVLVLFSR
jgi:hypothetical protein